MEQVLSFEQLPQAVTTLIKEVSELKRLLIQKQETPPTPQPEQVLKLTVPTVYTKAGRRELPVIKRGKRLYFPRTELLEYLKAGRKKSNAEIEQEAEAYLLNTKKGGLNNGK
jgi:hypothetical protein